MEDSTLFVLNALLASDAFFKRGDRELGMSMLVCAEQRIAHISDAQMFLRAQVHADRIWAAYLIQTCLGAEQRAELALDVFEMKKAS